MKNKFFLVFSFLLFVSMLHAETDIPKRGSTVFVNRDFIWCYSNDGDLEKQPKGAKGQYLYFGNKVTVTWSKRIKDTDFLEVQLPDKTKIWSWAVYFTPKFITITQKDVKSYSQPDAAFANKNKLQPGYLGYFVKEQNGWINVNFEFYAPRGLDEKATYVGNVWLNPADKSIYSEDYNMAKDANVLLSAYNSLYGKSVAKDAALKRLKKGMEESDGRQNICVNLIKDLITSMEPQPK
jgi:hypothetical protein